MAAVLERVPHVRVGEVDIIDVTRETVRELEDDDVAGMAAAMAYHSLLAVFPFLLFLAGLTSVIDNVFSVGNLTDRIVDKAGQVMPEDAQSVLRDFTDEVVKSDGAGAIGFGLFFALYSASNATGAAMKALNRAYDVKEDRGFIKKKITAVGITIVFVGLIVSAAILMGTGQFMAKEIGDALGWEQGLINLWNWFTIPAVVLLVGVAVAVLYALAPNTDHQWRWISPGAALFIVGWVLASLAFAYYVSNFASYNKTYGSLGAVILLMVWLYWTSFLLLVGGEVNAVLARRHDPEYQREQGPRPETGGSRANP